MYPRRPDIPFRSPTPHLSFKVPCNHGVDSIDRLGRRYVRNAKPHRLFSCVSSPLLNHGQSLLTSRVVVVHLQASWYLCRMDLRKRYEIAGDGAPCRLSSGTPESHRAVEKLCLPVIIVQVAAQGSSMSCRSDRNRRLGSKLQQW